MSYFCFFSGQTYQLNYLLPRSSLVLLPLGVASSSRPQLSRARHAPLIARASRCALKQQLTNDEHAINARAQQQ